MLDQEKLAKAAEIVGQAKKDVGDGPWANEPDRFEFRHAGLPCLMVRHMSLLHWCGYAGVAPGHPLHGVGYAAAYNRGHDLEAHGELTYADSCKGHVCHVPEPGEPDAVWWFGFDCAHFGDLSPGMLQYRSSFGRELTRSETYRDFDYVKREVERLAEQLAEVRQ